MQRKNAEERELLESCVALSSAPLLDVRSPGEFLAGHVPGAISFPLFTDAERALVGTCYKKESAAAAFELGLSLVGPRPPLPSEVALYEPHHFARKNSQSPHPALLRTFKQRLHAQANSEKRSILPDPARDGIRRT